MERRWFWWTFIAALPGSSLVHAAEPPLIQLKAGDRVVLLGEGFLERDRHYGAIETALRSRFPGVPFVVRNLSVHETDGRISEALASKYQLAAELRRFKPTLLFLGYGASHANAKSHAVACLMNAVELLMDVVAANGAPQVVILSPIRREKLPPPFVDPKIANQKLETCTARLRNLGAERKSMFVDLFHSVVPENGWATGLYYTEDGINLSGPGHAHLAETLVSELGMGIPRRELIHRLDVGKQLSPLFLRFENDDPGVKNPRRVGVIYGAPMFGRFLLRCEGRTVAAGAAADWALGAPLSNDFFAAQFSRVEREVVWKESLWASLRRSERDAAEGAKSASNRRIEELERLIHEADRASIELSKPLKLELIADPTESTSAR